ncbi:uncharacterized protein LOC131595877 [Vicia villosa]|uniref:uncharacterized protein LOC131595877 n=1 Tax=Vicia villosa TaxID=3911 RepID=UPI00273CD4FC|nr:uncharacterized protein LOC131595877 [Vicia villosa]
MRMSKANSAHYKILGEKKGKHFMNHGKPDSAPADKDKQKVVDGKRSSGGGAPTTFKCFRCGELGHHANECNGHISTHFQKPKKASTRGKVFALSETRTSSDDKLIRGICYINSTPLISIIDTDVTHSFIVAYCVKRLCLVVSFKKEEMGHLDVTLGINGLEFNHVHMNYYNNSAQFLAPDDEE